MQEGRDLKSTGEQKWRLTLLLILVLAVGVLFTGWMVHRADQTMRDDLLVQARPLAHAVNIGRVKGLTGTEADLDSPDYLRLKEQLAHEKHAIEGCRFVYLMGRRTNGDVFFFVDNEITGSEDESPAGQVYEEVSDEFRLTFKTKMELVEGPYTDRWGTWISALVPITDRQTSDLIAVFGIDIDASDWYLNLVERIALPVGTMLTLLIVLTATIIAVKSKGRASVKPVQRRLLIPLTAVLLLLVGGFGVSLLYLQKQDLAKDAKLTIERASNKLNNSLSAQSEVLGAHAEILIADPRLRSALKRQDRQTLLAAFEDIYLHLRDEHNITHFYFHRPDLVNLLRVHNPARNGDPIDRFTAIEAERTGQKTSGIELGPLGTFTLRVVVPVHEGDVLIGYLEIGKEIEDILSDISADSNVELTAIIHKRALDRTMWEAGMEMLGRDSNWDRFADAVIIYSSLPHIPDEFEHFISETAHTHDRITAEVEFDRRDWVLLVTPLIDVSCAKVGDLMILLDVSEEKSGFNRLLSILGALASIILATLIGFLFVLLLRTDQSIQLQQLELQNSENKFRTLYESSSDAVMILGDTGFTDCNQATLELFGCFSNKEFCSKHPADLSPELQSDGADSITLASEYVDKAHRDGSAQFEWLHKKIDGTIFQAEVLLTSMAIDEKEVIQAVVRDVTERKYANQLTLESRKRAETILQAIQNGILIIDSETHEVVEANPAALKMIGSAKEEVIGQVCHSFVCSKECGNCPITDLGETVNNRETILLTNNEKKIPILKTVIPIMLENRACLLESFVDITERKQAEEQMARQAEDLRVAKELQEENNRKLTQSNREFERFNNLAVGRELKMIKLKQEINELMLKSGGKTKYNISTESVEDQAEFDNLHV